MKMLSFSFYNPNLKYGNVFWASVKKSKTRQNTYKYKREKSGLYAESSEVPIYMRQHNIYKINLVCYFKFIFKVYQDLFPLCKIEKFIKNKHKYLMKYSKATLKCNN